MSDNLPTVQNAVISVDELQEAIGSSGTRDQKRLNRLCYIASDAIEAICNGTLFVTRTITEDHSAGLNVHRGGLKRLRLNKGPIVTVTSITDDDSNTVPAADYTIFNGGFVDSYLEHDTFWPAPVGRWTVVYVAGIWADTDDVAYAVKEAAFLEAKTIEAQSGEASTSISMSSRAGSKSKTKSAPGMSNPVTMRLLHPYLRRHV